MDQEKKSESQATLKSTTDALSTANTMNSAIKKTFLDKKENTKIEILRINAMSYRVCIQFLIDVIHWVFELAGKGFKRDIVRNAIYLLEMLKSNLDSLLKDRMIIIMIDELDA